jgi:hypothetical protein
VFAVAPNASKSFTRYFGVGDGSGANAINLENLIKGKLTGEISGCVTVNGVAAPGARVSIGKKSGSNITGVTSTWVTDAAGCYAGNVPVANNYGVAAWREGTPYEGGGSTPTVHTVNITAATPVVQDIDLPLTGHVNVTVVDESSDAVPARISVVGFDPSPEIVLGGGTGLFRDRSDVTPFGIPRSIYTAADGTVQFDMEPGSYRIYVSRGTEYSLYDAALTVTAGLTSNVNAQIARVISTPELHLLGPPRARHPQRRLTRERLRSRPAVRGRRRGQHHHDRPSPPHGSRARDYRARLYGVRHGDDRRRNHDVGYRPLQRLSVHDRSDASVGRLDGLGWGGAGWGGLPVVG